MALPGERDTGGAQEGRGPSAHPERDSRAELPHDRDALIEFAKQRLLALVHGQTGDEGAAAVQLARAEAALRVAKLDDAMAAERLRRAVVYFAIAAGLILLTLASCRVTRIEVEGVVRSESVFFRTSDFDVLDLEASTPRFSASFGDGMDGSGPVPAPVDVEARDSGQIAINQISLAKDVEVQLSTTPDGIVNLQVRCGAGCDTAWINLTFSGSVRSRNDTLAVARAGPVELRFARGENYLEFALPDSASLSGTSVIRADSLAFGRDQFRVAGERERLVNAPTVVSGEIRNLTMNGERQALSRNDQLTIGSGPFTIRSVRLEGGTFVTEFTGKPRELAREGRGLVPSRLEWLWTRRPLVMLWTIFASLVATMAAAIRWKTGSS